MGQAIWDYASLGYAPFELKVISSMFEDDVMAVDTLFRTKKEMPSLEQKALSLCRGRVLDVGTGAGCHSLALQEMGMEVTAIDISDKSVQACRLRGVKDARTLDFYSEEWAGKFDTIILLMNGIGIAGTLEGLPRLLLRCKDLLAPGGKVLADSSDLRYIYEDEEGHFDWNPSDGYYGEVDFAMAYGEIKGPSFNWLYVDYATLKGAETACGMKIEKVAEGTHFDYLAALTV